jgi:hypothetical protein
MGEMKADLQFWLYVIVGVIYLISRLRKKPQGPTDFPEYGPENPVPQREKNQPGRAEEGAPKQLTFEELLKEITEGKTPPKTPPTRLPEPVYETYEDDEVEEEQDLEVERGKYRDESLITTYEEAKRQAFVRPSLEETMKLQDTEVKFGRFREFEKEDRRDVLAGFLSELKDPEGLKKAIVMSEILKRKF